MSRIVTVGPIHPKKQTSKLVDPDRQEVTVSVGTARRNCFWNDEEYEIGTTVRTEEGVTYICRFGYWEKQEEAQ